ncbi:sodium-dependent multivitamin transporter-like [Haliotis asinina]|uniref:sodium-dependent multivitamin transporter-like n=1 Tax=Haliotis asinina TaxID=109174 RepID=UPI003531A8FD
MDGEYSINTGVKKTFGNIDYVFFGSLLAVSTGIGVFYAFKDKHNVNSKDYLLGGRKMNVVPVSLSILVTSFSATTLLGMPAEVYTYNTMIWWLCISAMIGLVISSVVFVPFFYNLNVTSIYEYLEMRFGTEVRVLGSTLFVIKVLLYISFVLYVPSLALSAATEFSLWGSVAAVGTVVTVYTTIGGMKAVLWTDTFQSVIIVGGLTAALVQGSNAVGGIFQAWRVADERSRIYLTDFNLDPSTRHSFWSLVLGGGFIWISLFADQVQIQRTMSCPSVKTAKLSMLICAPFLFMIMSICCLMGVIMFAFYKDCHPVGFNDLISRTDQILPLYIMDILGHLPGVPGIFISCIFSGSLSSLSSALNALGAVIPRDLIQPCCCGRISDRYLTIMSKLVVLGCGFGSIGLTFVVSRLGSVLQATYTIGSITNGPLFGLFILGMFFPSANKMGAFIGSVTSLIIMTWIGMGAFITRAAYTPISSVYTDGCNWNITTPAEADIISTTLTSTTMNASSITELDTVDNSNGLLRLYSMSYMWYMPVAVIAEVIVGLIVSYLTKPLFKQQLNPMLICPLLDYLCPCLPEKIRACFQSRQPHDTSQTCSDHNCCRGWDEHRRCDCNCVVDHGVLDTFLEMNELTPRPFHVV